MVCLSRRNMPALRAVFALVFGCATPTKTDSPEAQTDSANARRPSFDAAGYVDTLGTSDGATNARVDAIASDTWRTSRIDAGGGNTGPKPGDLFQPCNPEYPAESGGCDSYICAPTRFGDVCTHNTGVGMCIPGYKWGRIWVANGDWIDACLPVLAIAGQPCTKHNECVAQTSLGPAGGFWQCAWSIGNLMFAQCTSSCWGGECPHPSTVCTEGQRDKAGPCIPTQPLACPRSAVLNDSKGPCKRTNEHGTCTGTATCADYGPDIFPTCDAPEPATETCGPSGKGDDVDQDCDGATDEGCAP